MPPTGMKADASVATQVLDAPGLPDFLEAFEAALVVQGHRAASLSPIKPATLERYLQAMRVRYVALVRQESAGMPQGLAFLRWMTQEDAKGERFLPEPLERDLEQGYKRLRLAVDGEVFRRGPEDLLEFLAAFRVAMRPGGDEAADLRPLSAKVLRDYTSAAIKHYETFTAASQRKEPAPKGAAFVSWAAAHERAVLAKASENASLGWKRVFRTLETAASLEGVREASQDEEQAPTVGPLPRAPAPAVQRSGEARVRQQNLHGNQTVLTHRAILEGIASEREVVTPTEAVADVNAGGPENELPGPTQDLPGGEVAEAKADAVTEAGNTPKSSYAARRASAGSRGGSLGAPAEQSARDATEAIETFRRSVASPEGLMVPSAGLGPRAPYTETARKRRRLRTSDADTENLPSLSSRSLPAAALTPGPIAGLSAGGGVSAPSAGTSGRRAPSQLRGASSAGAATRRARKSPVLTLLTMEVEAKQAYESAAAVQLELQDRSDAAAKEKAALLARVDALDKTLSALGAQQSQKREVCDDLEARWEALRAAREAMA